VQSTVNLQFYTLREFAKLLRVDPCTVWRWRRRKLLRVTKIGGRVLVPVGEVNRLLREGTELRSLASQASEARQS
jgi:excisionase family DNA binding protein